MTSQSRTRIVFFGSGKFGLPTLRRLATDPDAFDIPLVVSQPARPAGRRRQLRDTPIAEWARQAGLPVIMPENVNDPTVTEQVRAVRADVYVVIAFGQKIGQAQLTDTFAINLHASLLPKYRGAAPINRAMISGDEITGNSVITLADRMDAGHVLASRSVPIDPLETAGELHDRLAALGPDLITRVIEQYRSGRLHPVAQKETEVTLAPKLRKEEGTVDFTRPAQCVRAHIHGLIPWPGCTVRYGASGAGDPMPTIRIGRVRVQNDVSAGGAPPGTILPDRTIACGSGSLELLEVQAPGGRMMPLNAFLQGRDLAPGARLLPFVPD